MAEKRSATTELNHDNWNEENEPEDAGVFTKASDEVLEKRVVKAARRRLPQREGSTTNSVFGTFTNFKTTPTTNSSPFSFLANSTNVASPPLKSNANATNTTSNGAVKTPENGADKKDALTEAPVATNPTGSKKTAVEQQDGKPAKKSSDYFAKLKGLNESVAQWIKTHVDANPFCILTPIFKDYEKYLKEIEAKHGSETDKAIPVSEQIQATHSTDINEASSVESKSDNSPFGGSSSKSLIPTEWKPEKSIFGNVNMSTKSIFGRAEQTDSTKSIFSNAEQTADAPKPVFPTMEISGIKSIFGSSYPEKSNPFLSKPSNTSDNTAKETETKSDAKSTATSFSAPAVSAGLFSFGQSSTTNSASAGFSFGSTKFTFDAQAVKPQETDNKEGEAKEEEDDEPPKPDFKPVTEEGAIYEQRCKVFVKKDGTFGDRGIGTLFLKPTPNGKTQLIVRAETSLGNLILNTLLTDSIPTKRMNKNTIMMVCLPKPDSQPPPVSVLLRVKTDEDADALLEALNKHKK